MSQLYMIYKYFINKLGLWVDYVWFISILEIKLVSKVQVKTHGFGLLDCTYNESFKETKQFYQMNHSKTTYNRTKVDVVEKKWSVKIQSHNYCILMMTVSGGKVMRELTKEALVREK